MVPPGTLEGSRLICCFCLQEQMNAMIRSRVTYYNGEETDLAYVATEDRKGVAIQMRFAPWDSRQWEAEKRAGCGL